MPQSLRRLSKIFGIFSSEHNTFDKKGARMSISDDTRLSSYFILLKGEN